MNYLDIIDNFKNRFNYVEDYEGIIEYLESLNVSLTEINEILYEILKWNIEQEKILNEKLESSNEPLIKSETPYEIKKEHIEEKQINTYYKKLIEDCDDTDFITEILPSTNNTAFEEIIYSVLLSFYKELVCTNEIKKSAQDELEKEYLKEEENKLNEIIKIIKEYHKEETTEEEIVQEKQNTKIIYMTNQNNTPYFFIDTENINSTDLQDIESIIENLKNGINRHEKKFTNHEDLKGISSIRKKDVRVIFTRIDNSIIILGAFVKRFQNPSIYRDLLKRRNKTFKNQKEMLKEKLQDQEFIKTNNKLTKSILKQNKKNK